jgi:hypothetical protein
LAPRTCPLNWSPALKQLCRWFSSRPTSKSKSIPKISLSYLRCRHSLETGRSYWSTCLFWEYNFERLCRSYNTRYCHKSSLGNFKLKRFSKPRLSRSFRKDMFQR